MAWLRVVGSVRRHRPSPPQLPLPATFKGPVINYREGGYKTGAGRGGGQVKFHPYIRGEERGGKRPLR